MLPSASVARDVFCRLQFVACTTIEGRSLEPLFGRERCATVLTLPLSLMPDHNEKRPMRGRIGRFKWSRQLTCLLQSAIDQADA